MFSGRRRYVEIRGSTPVFYDGNPLAEMASKYAAELQRPTSASLSGEGSGEGCRSQVFAVGDLQARVSCIAPSCP